MQHSMLYYLRIYLVLVLVAVLPAVLLPGCSGSTAPQPMSTSPAQPAAPLDAAMPQLPAPDTITRQSATLTNSLMCFGADFRNDLASQHVSAQGMVASFAPINNVARTLSPAAFAIYTFDLSSLAGSPQPLRIELRGTTNPPDGNTSIYAALGIRGAWHWFKLEPTDIEVNSWQWGSSQAGFCVQYRESDLELVPAVIVIFGNNPVAVREVGVRADDASLAAGPMVFRRGWDGTIKGRIAFDGSTSVVGDSAGGLHVSFYDSSNGQLNYMRLLNRVWTTETVDCNSDTGLFNDLVISPGGSPTLAWYDPQGQDGEIGDITDGTAGLLWSTPVVFDDGTDPGGGPKADVGQHCRLIFDGAGDPHIFYNDLDNGRIKQAWKPAGSMVWLNEVVSQPGEDASNPVPMLGPNGLACAYVVNSHTGPFDLVFAQQAGPAGWVSDVLATDVIDPRLGSTGPGFCDGSVKPGTDMAVLVYSTGVGLKLLHREIAARLTERTDIIDSTPGAGTFVKLAMLGDGSVLVAHYNATSSRISYIRESPTLPDTYNTLPAIQLPAIQRCDDLDVWVSPADLDGDGFLDVALVVLTSTDSPLGASIRRREFTGHVTLIK